MRAPWQTQEMVYLKYPAQFSGREPLEKLGSVKGETEKLLLCR